VQGLTREPLKSYFPQTWSKVRSDLHLALGVTVAYSDEGIANHISGAVRVEGNKSTLVFEGELLREATRGTLRLLLELLEVEVEDTGDRFEVPSLGLAFGFRELGDAPADTDPCDYVVVEPKPA
jgi:hypothetical protein